ncbi:polyprenyl synthetase family protein [Amphiplicatus metriothermophilus]|uniref:Octaprenyl-diphosphate synthase n=1 Tax=Amphiplicatus metriothermophilus TaxID=1519374 RepID=A0A239PIL6_9PROT|nr:polyprenyl synthetase family protein [Amphiplicatus metriothermophilus]MBB5518014.1 octaprenyl-diphosphate synthase [Amphiplicatus metriothermophilus]SNT67652.1 octaprenyl-diphosphate synthase [Amphiplicatus metriothermophilus]
MGLAAASSEHAPVAACGFAEATAVLRRLTADDLERVNETILDRMRSRAPMIPELAGHLLRAGGKRIRPMLTLAAARLFGYRGLEHVKLAAAVELIHGATLLHDDVVDGSALRRGAQTANVIWGNKESVLVGDYIFSRAFELMVSAGDLKVLQILSAASGVIAEGEVLQLSTQNNLDATFEMYLAVIEAKTAALFAAAAEAGAVIAGCSEEDAEALRRYGADLGVAYQLVDDALDYSGAEDALGKRVGDDFREGKMTLPVVLALARAEGEETAFWRRVIAEGRQDADDFDRARAIMRRAGAIEDTIGCARRYAETALASLQDVRGAKDEACLRALADLAAASTRRSN